MLRCTRKRLSQTHFQSYKFNADLIYFDRRPNKSVIPNEEHDFLSKPKLDDKFKRKTYADETIDLRDKDHLELSESMRGVRERDFYQDHVYHEEWIRRDMQYNQKQQLLKMYNHLVPGNAINPWIWFPGDIVEVVSGPYAGQRGAIVTVLKYKNEIMVQNVNVQSITIPATESRPEQIMQREHPIDVRKVKHVDPTTNEVCDVRMITVRDKETGKKERRRVSLGSGVLLPIPKDTAPVYEGDPLHDTPLQDAEEDTYDEATELPVIIERKLKAIEDHFVDQLRIAHDYHREQELKNAQNMDKYQRDIIARTKEIIAQKLLVAAAAGGSSAGLGGDDDDDDTSRRTSNQQQRSDDISSYLDNALVDHILMSGGGGGAAQTERQLKN